ncbi:MAG TPA: NAD(P)-dependent oxidoreductase, partial [Candidatus Saccharimonadales bacterium]|nr:NAD(P)-dependent oxidoreductase [Candidatus Saccharimonadales bacterium]
MAEAGRARRGVIVSSSVSAEDAQRIIEAGRALGADIDVRPADDHATLDAALDAVPNAEFLLADFLPDASSMAGTGAGTAFSRVTVDEELPAATRDAALARVANIRWIQLAAAGVNQETGSLVWREAPQIAITTASGLPSVAMAQYIVAVILTHANRFDQLHRYRAVRDWSVRRDFQTEILVGRTLGLLGYGGTGRRVAHIARALGMRVAAIRRSVGSNLPERYRRPALDAIDAGPEPAEVWGIEALDRLLAESDYLACTLPLTPETRGLIGRREIGLMKPGAIVINVSRGPIFDEAALTEALREDRLGGAALDVFETEPLPAD